LYGPNCGFDSRTTIELIITIEPSVSFSAGANSRVSRNAAYTVVSKLVRMSSSSTLTKSSKGGSPYALWTRVSTRPKVSIATFARV
jgi:hypothetical protein